MDIAKPLFNIVIFPGFAFLVVFALFASWVDRKLVARFQNRVGPPLFQPLADLIKLLAKEDIIPEKASRAMFTAVPLIGLAGVICTIIYIPLWSAAALARFPGDLIVVLYLLSLPTFALFLGGWYSTNPFATVGATRTLTLLFGYEVPFLLAALGPAIATGTWEISEIARYQSAHSWLVVWVPVSFLVALTALVGKLERIPFDIPEAKTEIVAGPIVEYSGRRLAMFKLTFLTEMVVGAALICVLFLGGYHFWGIPYSAMNPWLAGLVGLLVLGVKIMFIVFLLSLTKAALCRLRVEQMVQWCLSYLGIPALLQIAAVIVFRQLGA